MKFLRSYGVALLMVVVACHQFVRVQTQSLSSWRGGGFGMYASFHPRHHDVWVERSDTGEKRRYQKYDPAEGDPVFDAVRWCLTWPNDVNTRVAVSDMPDGWRSTARVRVYRLGYDPASSRLTRELVADSDRQGEPADD